MNYSGEIDASNRNLVEGMKRKMVDFDRNQPFWAISKKIARNVASGRHLY
jgi:hypothetical protein